MIKLVALGPLGYAGYKYFQKDTSLRVRNNTTNIHNAVAGGPLSEKSKLQSTAKPPAN
jgi:hypothetical protein